MSDSKPDVSGLYQAALNHLARYAATEAGLRQVLLRRIDRWVRAQPNPDAVEAVVGASRDAVETVIKRLRDAGALSDVQFAESRARSLTRGGQSPRSIQMKLAAKGVGADLVRSVTDTDADTVWAAALVLARKRRIGPFRLAETADQAARTKELGMMARAGFSRDVAERALSTERDEAERRIFELRR